VLLLAVIVHVGFGDGGHRGSELDHGSDLLRAAAGPGVAVLAARTAGDVDQLAASTPRAKDPMALGAAAVLATLLLHLRAGARRAGAHALAFWSGAIADRTAPARGPPRPLVAPQ
jgi:hypothetical protein